MCFPFSRGQVSLLLCAMLAFAGCASHTTGKTALIKSNKQFETSAAELSARNQSLLRLYSAEIENAADHIIRESPSSGTRRQALIWKTEAIPALQASLLKTDPLAGCLDAWAFIMQMKGYMQQPSVKQSWGEFHSEVMNTLDRMDSEMEQLIRTIAPSANVNTVRGKMESWAQKYPLEAGVAGRKSVDATLLRQTEQSDLGAIASIKALQESIGDLTARLDSYNASAPKQARWQAELLLSDIAADQQVKQTFSDLATVSSRIEKASDSLDQMPQIMGDVHKTLLADVDGQRLAMQAFLREERVQALEALDHERIAAMAGLRDERLAATEDLRGERRIVLDALHVEETFIMNHLDASIERATNDFEARSRSLIDHFFVRALELVLLVAVLCFVGAWLLLRRFYRRRPSRDEGIYNRAA